MEGRLLEPGAALATPTDEGSLRGPESKGRRRLSSYFGFLFGILMMASLFVLGIRESEYGLAILLVFAGAGLIRGIKALRDPGRSKGLVTGHEYDRIIEGSGLEFPAGMDRASRGEALVEIYEILDAIEEQRRSLFVGKRGATILRSWGLICLGGALTVQVYLQDAPGAIALAAGGAAFGGLAAYATRWGNRLQYAGDALTRQIRTLTSGPADAIPSHDDPG